MNARRRRIPLVIAGVSAAIAVAAGGAFALGGSTPSSPPKPMSVEQQFDAHPAATWVVVPSP